MGILDAWPTSARTAISNIATQHKQSSSSAGSTDPMLITANRKYLVLITQKQDIPTINSDGKDLVVVGQVPEDLMVDHTVPWKAPWGAGLAGDGTVGDLLAVTMGSRLLSQVQTIQVWQGGGESVDFTITIEFRAWSDVDRDVMIPLQLLSSMAMPSVDPSTGWLRSPGPILDRDGVSAVGRALVSSIATVGTNTITAATDAMKSGGDVLASVTSVLNTVVGSTGQALGGLKATIENALKNKISIRIGDWFWLQNAIIKNVQYTMKPQQPGPDGGIMSATASITFSSMFCLTASDIPSLLMTRKANAINAIGSGFSAPSSSASRINAIGTGGVPGI